MKPFVRLSVCLLLAVPPRVAAAQAQPASPAQPAAPADAPAPAATPVPAPDNPPPAPDASAQPPAPPPAAMPPAPAPAPAVPKGPEFTSLRLLHDKGVISDAELASALKDIGITGAADATTLVLAKLKTTIFGYIEGDFIYHSTETCSDLCNGAQIQRSSTYKGNHGRTVFSPRDSRLGFRIAAPEEHGIRVSGVLETDFFGAQAGTTEPATYTNPVLRIRNAWFKMETPVLDVLIGQTWSLFGWQPNQIIASLAPPGLPGQMFQRTPQLRLSKTIKTPAVNVDIAAAANRPPQQDSAVPEGVAGIRLSLNKWTGQHSTYMVANSVNPASISVTGDLRMFRFAEFAPVQHTGITKTGGGVSFQLFLPIVPATKQSKDNALSLTAGLDIGRGTSDMYTGLGGAGTANAALPPAMMGGAPVPYAANFDAGLAAVDALGNFELIKWTSYLAGLEFYPAGTGGKLGLFASYGHQQSPNAKRVGTASPAAAATPAAAAGAAAKIRDHEDFFEAGLFVDPTSATRIAVSGSFYDDTYGDGVDAKDYAATMGAWLFF